MATGGTGRSEKSGQSGQLGESNQSWDQDYQGKKAIGAQEQSCQQGNQEN